MSGDVEDRRPLLDARYLVRDAQRADIAAMKLVRDHVHENALVGVSIDEPEYVRALFDDGRGWVCEREGRIAGFACGRIPQRDVWGLFVDRAHEGRGIGSALMDRVEAWLFANGCAEIALTTERGTRAERLYRRRGWIAIGVAANGDLAFRLRADGPRTRVDQPWPR
jgi:GNAT superfamily N-acetyltransferase